MLNQPGIHAVNKQACQDIRPLHWFLRAVASGLAVFQFPDSASFGKNRPLRAMAHRHPADQMARRKTNDQVWTHFVTEKHEAPEMLRFEAARPLQAYSVSTST